VLHQQFADEKENDRCPNHAAENGEQERQPRDQPGVLREQIPDSTKPREKCSDGSKVDGGQITRTQTVCMRRRRRMRVEGQVPQVKVRQVDMQVAKHKRNGTQQKSDDETHQVKVGNGHNASPACALAFSGFSTSVSRSTSSGVSRIALSSTRHLRESSCLASCSNAWQTRGSRRKRSAPL